MRRHDERFQVTCNNQPVAESATLAGALKFAGKYSKYGNEAIVRDSKTGREYNRYGREER